jgi:hypothetical protein
MLDKIPSADRSGVDARSSAENVRDYLTDKDASHIKPHSKGGSGHSDNIKWEDRSANRARGDQDMTQQEQFQLDFNAQIDNLAGAVKAGFKAAPRGAVIAAATTLPFAMLRNALRVVRGEISTQDAINATLKTTVIAGGAGGATALTVATIAAASQPIAMVLGTISPALLVIGGAGMVKEFFNILDDHKQQTKKYYENVTQRELNYLKKIEDELICEHNKNMEFLSESQSTYDLIANRPIENGVEGALKRYLDSAAIAKSLGVTPVGSNLLNGSVKIISSSDY